ncbi:hypothetical protein [Aquimarina litoralis]|uniref:hypothetical protein n=1 Tax=Aquimarina litoralis TaxID=584605 RepID=UPI001C59B395|nr:hypothetical protein [Aquimarina litoralis]MBW1298926.1 hypothetical protein [Aquimarina litoralis]
METDIQWSSRTIQVLNEKSVLTLKINKSKFFNTSKIIGLIVFFAVYVTATILSYFAKSELFPELLKVGFVIGLIAFVTIKSKNNFKSKSA